ncbi:MAG: molybdenum cofactor biosynthesis protein MoaE, partial [Vicinamibacteria bacterium]
GTRAAIHHRLGTLAAGDVSIVIATASAHRAAAYAASRYAIERVKQIAPIWKHEPFEGGGVWVEGAVAGEDDEAARRRALEIACA